MTRAAREAAARTGKLPHEILLEVARGGCMPGRKQKPTYEQQLDAAKAAAPYYAPRLLGAVVKHNPDGNPWAEIVSMVSGKSRGLPAEVSKRSAAR
jgi:hypothetical protein